MSGGSLVVLDRLGRDLKRYPLPEGVATLGSDPHCDICLRLSAASPYHATVAVHNIQTLVKNTSSGNTLVNGKPVSLAALQHGDTITISGRTLRWEYTDPEVPRPFSPQPALYSGGLRARRTRRGSTAITGFGPAIRFAIEMQHRASMPGATGGKQVAVVQPQRRDTGDKPAVPAVQHEPVRASRSEPGKRRPLATTKAAMWIESRKPRPHSHSHSHRHTLAKIEGPSSIDRTKRVAILLMTKATATAKRAQMVANARNSTPRPKNRSTNGKLPRRLTKRATPKKSTPKQSRTRTPEPNSVLEEPETPVLLRSILDGVSFEEPVEQRRSPRVNVLSAANTTASANPKSAGASGRSARCTPPSGVRPAPSAVKERHSTAKKPHSRRSIIDDLSQSAVAKRLFGSPVKRSLALSMAEPPSGRRALHSTPMRGRGAPVGAPDLSRLSPIPLDLGPIEKQQESPKPESRSRSSRRTPTAQTPKTEEPPKTKTITPRQPQRNLKRKSPKIAAVVPTKRTRMAEPVLNTTGPPARRTRAAIVALTARDIRSNRRAAVETDEPVTKTVPKKTGDVPKTVPKKAVKGNAKTQPKVTEEPKAVEKPTRNRRTTKVIVEPVNKKTQVKRQASSPTVPVRKTKTVLSPKAKRSRSAAKMPPVKEGRQTRSAAPSTRAGVARRR